MVLRPEIFTRATELPRLASAYPSGDGDSQNISTKRGKKWLINVAY